MSDLSIPDPAAAQRYKQSEALDIQHDTDPADDHGDARRIPHLGHALLFFTIGIFSIFFSIIVIFIVDFARHPESRNQPPNAHLAAIALFVGYVLTFLISFPVFPLLWHRSFLNGIHWTYRAARLRWWKLVLFGILLCGIAQGGQLLISHFFKTPNETTDVLKLLDTPASAWLTAIFGALVAPLVEEIAFRGFLLPAIATGYDWLSLDRTPAAYYRWRQTTAHTTSALVLAAVVSSAAFAALHGSQLHWPVGPLLILFGVSLAFSWIRIRFQSVAASALVHISYNAVIFFVMIIATGGFRHLDKLTH